MSKSVFSCVRDDPQASIRNFSRFIYDEFYLGEMSEAGGSRVSLFADKGLSSPVAVFRIYTHNQIIYRRTQRHVQTDRQNNIVICKIRRGSMNVVRSDGGHLVNVDEILIHDVNTPIYSESFVDGRGVHESVYAIVPFQLLYRYICGGRRFCLVLRTTSPAITIASQTLDLMLEQGHLLDATLGNALAEAFVVSLGQALSSSIGPGRTSVAERDAIQCVEDYIFKNISNNRASLSHLCSETGKSRYTILKIMRDRNVTFRKMMRDARLSAAQSWLKSSEMEGCSVKEISLLAGFKSPEHFSRAFRAKFGISPLQAR